MSRMILGLLFCAMLGACGVSDTPAPVTVYGQSGGASSAGIHTVSSGETLWTVAQRYQMDMKDIIYLNKLNAPYHLRVGQRLSLPPPTTYRIRSGDTLHAISRTFNVSISQIVRQNNMRAPYTIHAGDTLRLPSSYTREREEQTQRLAASSSSGVVPQTATGTRAAPTPPPPRVTTPTPARASSRFLRPVEGRVISSYGPKQDGLHNDGINIAAPRGTNVLAAENGVIVYASDQLAGYGNLVLIRHQDNWMTAYAHMDRVIVDRGQEVRRGQPIGTVGSTGQVDTPQLHFEVRRGTKALNPELYLAGPGS